MLLESAIAPGENLLIALLEAPSKILALRKQRFIRGQGCLKKTSWGTCGRRNDKLRNVPQRQARITSSLGHDDPAAGSGRKVVKKMRSRIFLTKTSQKQ
jgi:hypothetical protein